MKLIAKAGGVIPTQNYGNYQPEYTIELEAPDSLEEARVMLEKMRDIVEAPYSERDRRFREIMDLKLTSSSPDRPFKIRWYNVDGNILPSVTSIIHPYGLELDEEVSEWGEMDLSIYAMRGTIVHDQMEHFFKQNEWMDMSQHKMFNMVTNYRSGVIPDGISPLDCNFRGFWEKYGSNFEVEAVEMQVSLPNVRGIGFAGRLDMLGKYNGLRAIADVKTASNYKMDKLSDYFTQMAGYDLAFYPEGGPSAEVYVVIPLKPKNKCGFGRPITTTDVGLYRKRFIELYDTFWTLPGMQEEYLKAVDQSKKEKMLLTKE